MENDASDDAIKTIQRAMERLRDERGWLIARLAEIDRVLGGGRHGALSLNARILAFLGTHPASSLAAIIAGVSAPSGTVASRIQTLYSQQDMLTRSGNRGSYRYSLKVPRAAKTADAEGQSRVYKVL